MICPSCGNENDDNWPLRIDGKIVDGGCQECWEAHCSDLWWDMVDKTEHQKKVSEGMKSYWRKRKNETKTN